MVAMSEKTKLTVKSIAYDAATGALSIDSGFDDTSNAPQSFTVALDRFSIKGQSNSSYKLTTSSISVSAGSFSVTLNDTDKIAINNLLGASTSYRFSAESEWATGDGFEAKKIESASLNVSNLPSVPASNVPQVSQLTITKVDYDAATGKLLISADGVSLLSNSLSIIIGKFKFTGKDEDGDTETHTLEKTPDSIAVSGATISIDLHHDDVEEINELVNGSVSVSVSVDQGWATG